MVATQMSRAFHCIRTLALHQHDGAADGNLLDLYVRQKDEAAFEALVRRHGRMVLGVCRRILGNSHDAEDAFQATFLVLVRKAASVRPAGMVGNWLYGVAHRTALEARRSAAKRRAKEAQVAPRTETPDDSLAHLRPLLDQELKRLPDKYRAVLVLCDLEGRTRKEAALQLGLPEGTIASRQATARVILAKRLTRHGVTLSGGALAAVLAQEAASASAPLSLIYATIRAATAYAAGPATVVAVSAPVAALTEGVLKAMLLSKLKIGAAVLVMVSFLGAGLGANGHLYPGEAEASGKAEQRAEPKNDNDRLQGTWQLVSITDDGKEFLSEKQLKDQGRVIIVKGDTFTEAGKEFTSSTSFKFKLNESKSPKAIDAFDPEHEDKVSPGIYSLKGDRLTMCYAKPGKPRPTEFSSRPGSGWNLLVYKRGQPRNAQPPQDQTKKPANTETTGKNATEKNQTKQVLDMILKGFQAYQDAKGDRERVTAIVRVPSVYTTAVALKSNGTLLATGGSDHSVRLWDVSSGKELYTLKGHTVAINCLAFSPDGKTLASATGDWVRDTAPGEVKLWDVATGKERAPVKGHAGFVMSLAFSPDSKTLASASDTVKVWDVVTGKEKAEIPGSGNSLAFSKNGTTLAVGRGVREDNTPGWVELRDTTTWKERGKLPGHVGMVPCVVFSPDGKTLVSTDSKGTLKLWDVATAKERFSIENADCTFFLQPLAFTADGQNLVSTMRCNTGQGDGAVLAKVWEVAGLKERATYSLPPEKEDFLTPFMALSADGKTLAIGGFERLDKGKRPQSEWKINGVIAVWEIKSLPASPPKKSAGVESGAKGR